MDNKVCIVTGGANGIGRCITEEFLNIGVKVAIIDTDNVSLEKLKSKYNKDSFLSFNGDITKDTVIDEFVEEVIKKFKRVDFLINNACISKKGILSNCNYEDFNYVLRLGVSAPYYLTKNLMPYFNKGGSIVNISSTRAYMSQKDTESYSAAKGGISSLTHALSISLAGKIRVNSINPGWIDTRAYQHDDNYSPSYSKEDLTQHPSHKVGNPLDIANMVIFLCSDKSTFINGENITIDGGMSKHMIYHNDHGWLFNNK